jgi:predicted hydrocarbon binding protein
MGEEFDASQHFLKMLRTGQFKVDKDGRILSEGVQMVLLPALTFAKLCKEVRPEVLRRIGEYQARKAIELHSRFFGLSVARAASLIFKGIMGKVLDYMIKSWVVDGWGMLRVKLFDPKQGKAILVNETNPVAKCYLRDFGRASSPIDHYFVGLFEAVLSRMLKRKVSCREEKCMACGDKACVFVIEF